MQATNIRTSSSNAASTPPTTAPIHSIHTCIIGAIMMFNLPIIVTVLRAAGPLPGVRPPVTTVGPIVHKKNCNDSQRVQKSFVYAWVTHCG